MLFGLKMLAGFAIALEGLAAPLAVELGAGVSRSASFSRPIRWVR
ncbi:hypothetical protein [Amycolatopsis sp. cmx-11-32]